MRNLMRVLGWPAFKNRAENPYNSLLYGPMAAMGVQVVEFAPGRLFERGNSVWHMHWPDNFLSYPSPIKCAVKIWLLFRLMDFARTRGVKVFWTVHNLKSHEDIHPQLEQWFWRGFTRRLDGYFSLSEAGRDAALGKFPALQRVPGFVVPHGHYRGMYADTLTREEARQRINLPGDAKVLAHVGKLRPYKNVPLLMRAFRALTDPRLVLLIAGEPHGQDPAYGGELAAQAEGDTRIRLIPTFVPESEIQVYMRAADLVVLPYSELLNSGSALLALSFDRPVLIPRKGSMQELQELVGADWVSTYEGEFTPAVLESSLRWALETVRPAHAPLEKLVWQTLAAKAVEGFRHVCTGGRNSGG